MFKNNAFKIETERLIIRCYKLTDAKALNNVVKTNQEHLSQYMPWAKTNPITNEGNIDLIRGFIGMYYTNEDYIMAIILKSGEFIGGTGLHTRRGKGILEIGYWIAEKHVNKGYATELSYALTKVGFLHIGIEKIEIRNDINNLASRRIPEKLGFNLDCTQSEINKSEDGRRIKTNIYCLFKEEFQIIEKFEPIKMFDALDRPLKF